MASQMEDNTAEKRREKEKLLQEATELTRKISELERCIKENAMERRREKEKLLEENKDLTRRISEQDRCLKKTTDELGICKQERSALHDQVRTINKNLKKADQKAEQATALEEQLAHVEATVEDFKNKAAGAIARKMEMEKELKRNVDLLERVTRTMTNRGQVGYHEK